MCGRRELGRRIRDGFSGIPGCSESLSASVCACTPTDFGVSIANAPGKESYPIASFIWFVLSEEPEESLEERKKTEVAQDFLQWVLSDGQKLALKLGYPALPRNLVQMELQHLSLGASEKPR